jgi:hypothetical protein
MPTDDKVLTNKINESTNQTPTVSIEELPAKDRFRFSLWSLFKGMTIAALLLAASISAIQVLEAADHYNRMMAKLRSLSSFQAFIIDSATPMEGYERPAYHYGAIPPAMYSWRLVLKYKSETYCGCIDEEGHSVQLDANVRWDDPLYRAFDDAPFRLISRNIEAKNPEILAIVGEDTAFDAIWVQEGIDPDTLPGDAIMLLDCFVKDVHWRAPYDIEVEDYVDQVPTPKLSPPNSDAGRYVCFTDGQVWLMHEETPAAELIKFFTLSSAAKYDRNTVLGKYQIAKYSPETDER